MNSQLSVRIDDQLRAEGTAALESIGLTPSSAIRALWSYAAKNKNNPVKLEHDLAFLEEDTLPDAELQRKLRLVEEGAQIMERGLKQLGLSRGEAEPLPYRELRDLAYEEHYREKGYL